MNKMELRQPLPELLAEGRKIAVLGPSVPHPNFCTRLPPPTPYLPTTAEPAQVPYDLSIILS